MARPPSSTLLARFRRAQATTTRAVSTLFAIAWLGLALQPCAAMGQDEAAEHGGHAGHAGHGGHSGDDGHASHDCPHCPSSGEGAGHAGTALACDAVGLPGVPSKATDTPQPELFPAIVGAAERDTFAAAAVTNRRLTEPPRQHPPSASLQRRYCSYLK